MAESLAGLARVAYETTGLTEFRRDQDSAERAYRQSTAGMSDAAIKLELAQERLRRSLNKGPAAANQSARALLQVRSAERELRYESDRTTRELGQQERTLGRLSRGALAGSGIFRGLGRSLAFASAGFLGGTGLVYGARSALAASTELTEQTTKSQQVFGSSAKEVIHFANDALGLARDQALKTASTLGALLRPLGFLEKDAAKQSVTLTKLGTDLASFYNTDVQSALDAIESGLVGQVRPLRRYGVELSAARVQAVALNDTGKESAKQLTNQEKVLARIKIILHDTALAQGDYSRTIGNTANQEREAQKNFRNTEILIGQTLQPAYKRLLGTVNDWLGQQKNQQRVQRDVNEVVHVGAGIVKGLGAGIKVATDVLRPFVDALGGVEKATELAFGAALLLKLKKAATSMGLLSSATSAVSRKGIADAEAFGAAWDIATRPRSLIVTTPTAPVPTTGAPTPTPSPGRGRPSIPIPGYNVPTAVAAGVLLAGGAGFRPGVYDPKKYPRVARLLAKIEAGGALTADEQAVLSQFGGKSISQMNAAELARLNAALAPQATGLTGGDRNRPNQGRAVPAQTTTTAAATKPKTRGTGLTRLQRLQLATQRAGLTKDLQDDLEAAQAEEAYYRKVASNEKLHGKALFEARQDLYAAEQKTQQVRDQIAAQQQEADQKAADARRKAAEKRRKAAEEARRKQESADLREERLLHRTSPRLKSILARERGSAATKELDDDIKALREEIKFWKGRLADLTKGTKAFDYVAEQVSKAQAKLQTKRAQAQKAAAAAREKAATVELPRRLRIAQLQAELTKDDRDDAQINKEIVAYWQHRLARTKKTAKAYEDILQQLVGAKAATTSTQDQGLTRAEIGSFFRDFLTQLQTLEQNRSTVAGGFAQTAVIEHLLREQTGIMRSGRASYFPRRPVDDAEFA